MYELKFESEDGGVRKYVNVTFSIHREWPELLETFLEFLVSTGYIIDQTILPEMVEACWEIHDKSLTQGEKHGR